VSRPRRSWLYSTANLVYGANYTIMDSRCYGCHSHYDGNSCSNAIRVRKDHIEDVLLRGPETGLAALLSPERVERMAKEMQTYYAERLRAMQTRAVEAPRELTGLAARIDRLRERLKAGDPDMTADEIQAAAESEPHAVLSAGAGGAVKSSPNISSGPRKRGARQVRRGAQVRAQLETTQRGSRGDGQAGELMGLPGSGRS
jgi:hypothetical protein